MDLKAISRCLYPFRNNLGDCHRDVGHPKEGIPILLSFI